MPKAKATDTNSRYRDLPSVDELLRSQVGVEINDRVGAKHAAALARLAVDRVRSSLSADPVDKAQLLARAEEAFRALWENESAKGVRRVINATGVIIHTNLGRAALSEAARQAMIDAAGYCTLEYDVAEGNRGRRGAYAEELLRELTGAEDALVVNNCAAAAFFILHTFAAGGEVVISRGELVEIGGDFRVPDVLQESRATLREVGTTNRTNIKDYERAINKETRMLLRVHPSNYRIVGFTASPSVSDLAVIAKKNNILLYEDLGSGALIDLTSFGLSDEPVVTDSIAAGADIVSFSGDKLLGGPQCGIIAGRRELIGTLRKHPLQRALRVDKKTFAALEATLGSYRRGTHFEDVPVLRQISQPASELASRAAAFNDKIPDVLATRLIDGGSVIGGGAAPGVHPMTTLIAISHPFFTPNEIDLKLRLASVPVISRIEKGEVLLDLRTVSESDEPSLIDALKSL